MRKRSRLESFENAIEDLEPVTQALVIILIFFVIVGACWFGGEKLQHWFRVVLP